MFSRVVRPGSTTYSESFTRKNVPKVRSANLSTETTTSSIHYSPVPSSLYKTDYSDLAQTTTYTRPRSFAMDLVQLPPDYRSTVKPELSPEEPTSNYRHYFGTCGQTPVVTKRSAAKPRTLSKATRAEIEGTTRITHHPPKYTGHIPREWKGNRGKTAQSDRTVSDFTWQYHTAKTGYAGYVPSTETGIDPGRLQRTSTTYRDMCDAVGYRL